MKKEEKTISCSVIAMYWIGLLLIIAIGTCLLPHKKQVETTVKTENEEVASVITMDCWNLYEKYFSNFLAASEMFKGKQIQFRIGICPPLTRSKFGDCTMFLPTRYTPDIITTGTGFLGLPREERHPIPWGSYCSNTVCLVFDKNDPNTKKIQIRKCMWVTVTPKEFTEESILVCDAKVERIR